MTKDDGVVTVVSNIYIFYFHPYLGKIPMLTTVIFGFNGVETTS